MKMCPHALIAALRKDAEMVSEIGNDLIRTSDHPLLKGIPEVNMLLDDMSVVGYKDIQLWPRGQKTCAIDLVNQGKEYVEGFFKSFIESFTNWCVNGLVGCLENVVTRQKVIQRCGLYTGGNYYLVEVRTDLCSEEVFRIVAKHKFRVKCEGGVSWDKLIIPEYATAREEWEVEGRK